MRLTHQPGGSSVLPTEGAELPQAESTPIGVALAAFRNPDDAKPNPWRRGVRCAGKRTWRNRSWESGQAPVRAR